MNRQEVLADLNFGDRIAEGEAEDLHNYFVETQQWKELVSGRADIVYGTKGSGKSALFALLSANQDTLLGRQIIYKAAENPRGATAFKHLATEPPATEIQFKNMWKLYFLCLAVDAMKDWNISDADFQNVLAILQEEKLITAATPTLLERMKGALTYVSRRFKGLEGGVLLSPDGKPSAIVGRILLEKEPSKPEQRDKDAVFIDRLLDIANSTLAKNSAKLWLGIDRLDVAFPDNPNLEENALRSLFLVYLDFLSLESISMKIFLRSDIWSRITEKGFREASHITKATTITWSKDGLRNLIVRRLTQNPKVLEHYQCSKDSVLETIGSQCDFFSKVFPDKVDVGAKKPTTFDWMLSRTCDGHEINAPRELIHLLNEIRSHQISHDQIGGEPPPGSALFSRSVIKSGLAPVSKTRLEQTIYAEYPKYRDFIRKLEGEKTTQTLESLGRVWGILERDAISIAEGLVEIGFFQKRSEKENPIFWIPFLYRDALNLVQGAAE